MDIKTVNQIMDSIVRWTWLFAAIAIACVIVHMFLQLGEIQIENRGSKDRNTIYGEIYGNER